MRRTAAQVLKPKAPDRPLHPAADLLFREAEVHRPEADVGLDAPRDELAVRILEHEADGAAKSHPVRRFVPDRFAAQQKRPGGGPKDAVAAEEEGAFSRAVPAKHRDTFARVKRGGEAAERSAALVVIRIGNALRAKYFCFQTGKTPPDRTAARINRKSAAAASPCGSVTGFSVSRKRISPL